MSDPLIDGVIRKLWIDRAGPYRDHLLRLDAESRRNRFGGAVSDAFIHKYIALPIGLDAVIHGYFVDGVLRGKYLARDKFFSALEQGFGFCDVVLGWLSVVVVWPSDGLKGMPGASCRKRLTAVRPPCSSKQSMLP